MSLGMSNVSKSLTLNGNKTYVSKSMVQSTSCIKGLPKYAVARYRVTHHSYTSLACNVLKLNWTLNRHLHIISWFNYFKPVEPGQTWCQFTVQLIETFDYGFENIVLMIQCSIRMTTWLSSLVNCWIISHFYFSFSFTNSNSSTPCFL